MSNDLQFSIGADGSEMNRGLQKAADDAQTFAGKIVSKVGGKLTDLKDVSNVVASALGINLKDIADGVARWFTGMSKEEEAAYKKAEELGDRATELAKKNMRSRMSEEDRYALMLKERDKLLDQISQTEVRTGADMQKLAERRIELETKIGEIHEIEKKREEERVKQAEKNAETRAKIADDEYKAGLERLSTAEKIAALQDGIAAAEALLLSTTLSRKEVEMISAQTAERKKMLLEAQTQQMKEAAQHEEKIEELAQKISDHEVSKLNTAGRIKALRFEEKELLAQLAQLEENSKEYLEATNRLLEVRKKLDSEKTKIAGEQKEMAILLLKGEENLTEIEKERLKLLRGQTTEKQQQAEIELLLTKGVKNLTIQERERLEVLTGQAKAIQQQVVGVAEMHRISIQSKAGLTDQELSDRELQEKIGNLRRNLNQAQIDDPTGQFSYLYNQDRSALSHAESEQAKRAQFRQLYGREGEAAFLRYSAFDEQRLRQYIRPEDEKRDTQQAQDIATIARKLTALVPNIP